MFTTRVGRGEYSGDLCGNHAEAVDTRGRKRVVEFSKFCRHFPRFNGMLGKRSLKGLPLRKFAEILGFLPPPPCLHFCKTVRPQNRPIFRPPPPLLADVLNGSPLLSQGADWFVGRSVTCAPKTVADTWCDNERVAKWHHAKNAYDHRSAGPVSGSRLAV